MKYRFEKINPEGDWFGEDREFFNTTYQNFLISSKVNKLQPKNDEFVMRLGLPETDWEVITNEQKLYYNYSYEMFIDIVRKGKTIQSFDLSEKNIPLEIGNYMDKLEVHTKGPCSKVLNFIDELLKTKIRK